MKQIVLKTIEKYHLIESGDHIVLGVSGGPDSMCLLHLLNQIRKQTENGLSFLLTVAHVNHAIRKEAQEETKYVQEYCANHQIPCYVKICDVVKLAKARKKGIEETGREERYRFFEEILQKVGANKIATAHNQNDKVETILMNIIRGCGSNGLKGIEPIREEKYIRPLIEVDRKQIEQYCQKEKLNPKIDASNFDNQYTRNRIRNELIPLLQKEFNPNFSRAITDLSEIVTQEQNFLENYVHTIYNQVVLAESNKEIILELSLFNKQEEIIRKRLILYTISKLFSSSRNIAKVHLEDILVLCQNNIGNKYLTPNKNTKILVNKGKIFFLVLE